MMTWMNSELGQNYNRLKNELLQKGIASVVTKATSPATDVYWHSNVQQWPGKRAGETIEMGTIIVAEDYFKTVGMTLIDGRDFNPADSQSVIYNEAAIQQMRMALPVGQTIIWDTTRRIIGVAKNALMVFALFRRRSHAILLFPHNAGNVMMYRLSPLSPPRTPIAQLNKLFAKYNPSYPYTYSFADDRYADKFKQELLVGKLAGIFGRIGDLHLLSRSLWAGRLCRRTAYKGDRHPQGVGRLDPAGMDGCFRGISSCWWGSVA